MSEQTELEKYQLELQQQEYLEHRDVLLAVGVLLKSKEGIQLFKYLFKNFEVGEVPERGMNGDQLHDYLGFLRAGNSIFKLVSEADPVIAGDILAKIEREKYDRLRIEHQLFNE